MKMRQLLLWMISAASAIALSACGANFNSIYRTTDSPTTLKLRSQVIFTDAKQSATVVKAEGNVLQVCAGRSPDVFSALATAIEGKAEGNFAQKVAASIGGSETNSETASAFGLRTQLTQTQIELLYQLCLNALNGNLSRDQLATELHRYQNTMVTMLAIEQLSGYARSYLITAGTNSSVGSAASIATLAKLADDAKNEADALEEIAAGAKSDYETKKSAATTAAKALADAKTAGKTGDDLKVLQDASDKAQAAEKAAEVDQAKAVASLTDQQARQKLYEQKLAQVKSGSASGTQSVSVNAPIAVESPSADAAKLIVELVKTQLYQTFTTDECLQYLFHDGGESDFAKRAGAFSPLGKFCADHLKAVSEYKLTQLYLDRKCDKDGGNCSKVDTSNKLPGAPDWPWPSTNNPNYVQPAAQ